MKRQSIIRSAVILPATAMAIMVFVILIVIHILSSQAVEYDIKRNLKKSINENMSNVMADADEIKISEDFAYERDNVLFTIVERNGTIIAGGYPENIASDLMDVPVINKSSRGVICEGEKYYVRDVRIWKGDGIYIRGIIKKTDADTPYEMIEIIAYISIAAVCCIFLLCELFLSKRIAKELKDMCQTAEQIGSSLDMSQRMKSDNYFQEIEVLAQANNRMLDRMEKTFQTQEQFTSDVAHELRTPVAVVLAQCQYAKERVKTKEEFQEVLDVIYWQSKKINTIITQLLNFSRLDQDRTPLENEMLDLVEITESVCEEQQEKAENGVSIRMDLKKAVTKGDISLIAIAIQNLVGNAVKFSRPGGSVDVSTSENDGWVYVTVEDYGIGMEQDKLECIFWRFYKCDPSRNAEGFGLGLPLSQRIAQKHGGRIDVSSEAGKGSVFTLCLPKK